jgi:hypothetical protein
VTTNFRSRADRDQKVREYKALLKSGVANQRRLQGATANLVESQRLGVEPTAPSQYRSADEEVRGVTALRNKALSHLRELVPRGGVR